jgi:DNA (cytosine-5)-methyltransferase 1
MNYLDLFSGIGGFALGARWAGIKFNKHYYSEIDEYACKVYAKHFPEAIALGDIKLINVEKLKESCFGDWIVTGGFPCQDISAAGMKKGIINGTRSGLWFEMQRIIGDLRPKFVIIENVGDLVIRGLDAILSSLAEIGYDAEWQDIRASDMGAPHRRERIWIVAYPRCSLRERKSILQKYEGEDRSWDAIKPRRSTECDKERSVSDTMLTGKRWDKWESKNEENAIPDTNKERLPRFRKECETEGSIGLCSRAWNDKIFWANNRADEDEWLARSGIRRVSNGVSKRMDRLKCLGNAIVPQIAEMLFRLLPLEKEKK